MTATNSTLHSLANHDVCLSNHAENRIQQRGLSKADLRLVMSVGEKVQDGYVMTKKAVTTRQTQLRRELQRLDRLKNVAVISASNTIITAYRADRRRIRKLRRSA